MSDNLQNWKTTLIAQKPVETDVSQYNQKLEIL